MFSRIPRIMDPGQVGDLIASGPRVRIIDVRTPAEFAVSHISDSHNLPLSLLQARRDELPPASPDPVLLVCESGARAGVAQTLLEDAGFGQTAVLDGGISAWEANGGALDRGGSRVWAMERQVRLVAGTLVLTGLLASLFYEPLKWFAGLIGAGLTFSALSNTCGMARVLSLLPYNRNADARISLAPLGTAPPRSG